MMFPDFLLCWLRFGQFVKDALSVTVFSRKVLVKYSSIDQMKGLN